MQGLSHHLLRLPLGTGRQLELSRCTPSLTGSGRHGWWGVGVRGAADSDDGTVPVARWHERWACSLGGERRWEATFWQVTAKPIHR